jgi:hypothetical protein
MFAKKNEFPKIVKEKNSKNKKIKAVPEVLENPPVLPNTSQEPLPAVKLETGTMQTLDLFEYIKTKPYRYSFTNYLIKGYKNSLDAQRSVDNVDFNRIYLENCEIINSRFYACNMYAANFCFTVTKNSELDAVNFATGRFIECTFENVIFKNANIQKSIFDGSVLKNIVFKRCNLTNTDFSRVKKMENVEFKNCHVEFMILPYEINDLKFSSNLTKENEDVVNELTKGWTFEQHCISRKVHLTDKDGRIIT